MKFYCDIEGLTENWVDVGERWTRNEMEHLRNTASEESETLAVFHSKVVACSLTTEDGETITNPKELTSSDLDRMRIELVSFIGGCLFVATRRLQTLGNAAVRLSSSSNETGVAPKPQQS